MPFQKSKLTSITSSKKADKTLLTTRKKSITRQLSEERRNQEVSIALLSLEHVLHDLITYYNVSQTYSGNYSRLMFEKQSFKERVERR